MGNRSVSKRGEKAAKSVMRVDLDVYFEAIENRYDRFDNPQGTFPLNVAENKLSWPLLKKKLQDIQSNQEIPPWVSGYTSTLGAPTFRKAVAMFMSDHLCHIHIPEEQLGISAGATSVIEVSSFILGDPGDVAVFPAPCYPVYRQDIGNVSALERYDLITHTSLSQLQNGTLLSIDHLDRALNEIEDSGKQFRMLVLTNPDNPTGLIYPKSLLENIVHWCIDHEIHCVVNELYGLSLIDTNDASVQNDYKEAMPYYSFANIIQKKQSDYLHLWYAFSKDFGISGLRVGVVYTLNETFLDAFQNLNLSHCVSNHTQWILEEVLKDEAFVSLYIKTNQQKLTESYIVVIDTLRKLHIPYVPARGSLFVWMDLSQYINDNTEESENALWMDLYSETGILLTPGQGFGHKGYGFFRMVYPFIPKADLIVAMDRFFGFILRKSLNI